MGRPKTNKYDIDIMVSIIEEYTNTTELPILKEVCYINHWNYDTIMKYQRDSEPLMQSIKSLLDKKEVSLERGAISGKYNNTMAIFSLKQLGWRDIQKENEDTDNKPIVVNINVTDNTNLEKTMYGG